MIICITKMKRKSRTNRRKKCQSLELKCGRGRTHEQKSKLAKAITEAMSDIAGAPPEATIIVFEDVSKDNWAESGTLASDA